MGMNSSLRIVLGTGLILLIPFIAMQFTDEVNWGLGDFVVMGALLLAVGFLYEFVSKKVTRPRHRLFLALALTFLFLLVWADLAVGIFNIPGLSGS